MVALSHALVVARAKVLCRERGDRHAKRLGNHPDNAIQAARKTPSRGDIGAKRVDRHLNQNVGNRIRSRLKAKRQTTRDHALTNARINAELGQRKPPRTRCVHHTNHDHRGVGANGQRHRDAAAQSLHMKHGNEDDIQHRINKAAGSDDHSRPARVAHGAQQCRSHIEQQRRNHGGKIATSIGRALGQ